ncbi:homoserine kinase [Parathalassolituus penaei]|uniref:Homoserine kinase n=1 Tax=Parathalassolituus penaei TaxID=2997323 RepID=A0A9X3EFU2_9GAMM|nr:homoserine kinase [Parathalassolituus penaei]MCY0966461.1 homoserine kinase [Parathalassolituus penaei]
MSVYTCVDQSRMAQHVALFDLGKLESFSGIEGGVENTNYRVRTEHQSLVLTLFEHHNQHDVQEFVRLARFLSEEGFRVPAPISDRSGEWLHEVAGKPAILCPFIEGNHPDIITARHCWQVGSTLAELHLASRKLPGASANPRGFEWWKQMYSSLAEDLDRTDYALLSSEMNWQLKHRLQWRLLPQGWIHGDLFRDNVLFSGPAGSQQLSAILDWYNACKGVWIYDLAVVANDWCCNEQGEWDDTLYDALLAGYQRVRRLSGYEQQQWPLILRGAALRFWLSRLATRRYQQASGSSLVLSKDPDEYRNKLIHRRGYESLRIMA